MDRGTTLRWQPCSKISNKGKVPHTWKGIPKVSAIYEARGTELGAMLKSEIGRESG